MRLSDHCYAVLGLGCYPPWVVNAGFITGATQTLVVDTSATRLSAQTVYGYATGVKPGNELLVINTEKHLDHLGGNCVFAEHGAALFGHALTKRHEDDLAGDREFYHRCIQESVRQEAQEELVVYQGTTIVNPTHPVTNRQMFDLGGIEACVLFTPGHTDTNLSVYVESEKILYTGDAVVQGYIPNLESSTPDGWRQWLASLDLIAELGVHMLVPGHGAVLADAAIPAELDRIRRILCRAIEAAAVQ